MRFPEWLKPGLWGAVVGAAGLAIVGFSTMGWVTGETAEKAAAQRAENAVAAALTPLCVQVAGKDPQLDAKLKQLVAESSWQRYEYVMKAGWATAPGAKDPNREVAEKCAEVLAKQASG